MTLSLQIMEITTTNRQEAHQIDEDALSAAVQRVLQDTPFTEGAIDVAIVTDEEIRAINLQYLKHDYATDVLSFPLEQAEPILEGQIVVSAETAYAAAADYGWTAREELLLYVIHGTLHLVGYCDKDPRDADEMRAAETRILAKLGIQRGGDLEAQTLNCSGGKSKT